MLLAEIVLDVAREHVAGRTDAVLLDQTAQGDHGDLRGTATDIDDHVALRRLDVEADTERRRHRFEDQEDIAAAGVLGGVAHGADLHFRGAGRDAHHNLEVGGEELGTAAAGLLDEAADHHLRRVEVGDHAVAQRPDGLDARAGPFVHQFGLGAEGDAFARIIVDSHDAGLIQHNLVILVNDGVGGTQIDSQFLIQKRESHSI